MIEKSKKLALKRYLREGRVSLRDNDFDTALSSYKEVAKILPTSSIAHLNISVALSCLGRIQDSNTELEIALLLNPQNALLHIMKGSNLMCDNKFDKAQEEFEEAIKLKPLNPLSYFMKIVSNLYIEDKAQARTENDRFINMLRKKGISDSVVKELNRGFEAIVEASDIFTSVLDILGENQSLHKAFRTLPEFPNSSKLPN